MLITIILISVKVKRAPTPKKEPHFWNYLEKECHQYVCLQPPSPTLYLIIPLKIIPVPEKDMCPSPFTILLKPSGLYLLPRARSLAQYKHINSYCNYSIKFYTHIYLYLMNAFSVLE